MTKKTIALDFGGTAIKAAVMENGAVVVRDVLENRSDVSDLERVAETAFALCRKAGTSVASLGGVGLSFPGIIDSRAKTIVAVNGKYPYAVGLDLEGWVQRTFSLPMVLDNDARIALIGEVGHGAAKGAANAVVMILGTGVGTAAMIDGRLLRGAHHQAGILGGHWSIETNGRECNCGNQGCVEAESGSWNLPSIVKAHPRFSQSRLASAARIDFKTITDAHRDGDATASDVMMRLIRCWSITAVNLIHAYDPEVLVLSGGLLKSHDLVVPPLRDYVHARAWVPAGPPDIRLAADADGSVLKGLDYLLNHRQEMEDLRHV